MLLGKEIIIGEPVFLRNLLVYPLRNGHDRTANVAGVDTLIDRQLCRIDELDPPVVNRVQIDNRSEQRLLLLDGEEILGAMQNRIAASTALIEVHSSLHLPTVCVEQDRWETADSGKSFFSGRSLSYPTLRAILAERPGPAVPAAESGQEAVWSEIQRKLKTTRVTSFTSSMHDVYEKLNDDINRYLEDTKAIGEASGLLACVANRCLAVDLFGSVETYTMFKDKLLKSYALDAIEHRDQPTAIPPELPLSIFSDLDRSRRELIPGIGLGNQYHIEGRRFRARILTAPDGSAAEPLVHLAAFPKQ